MPADQLFIGIDSGTQGTKAVVFSREQGIILAEAYAGHDLIENSEGRREQQPDWWIEAVKTVIQQVLGQHSTWGPMVRGIGVSGQQHGMVALDADHQVIRPAKLWCDTETSPQCDEITRRLGGPDRVVGLIGNSLAAGFTASKILWVKDNEPLNYDRIATVFLPHDYINFWLTGEITSEYGDASGTAYFDIKNRGWSDPVLNAIDNSGKLRHFLPALIAPDAPAGTLRSTLAKRFGLGADVVVSSGGGDNMMAAIGTGNVRPGIVTASLGTSGTIYSYSDKPVIDPRGELAAFCSSSGGWLPLVCTMNVTVSTELTRELFELSVDGLNAAASAAPPGSEGIVLLPYFNGERTPALPNAGAVLFGLTSTNYRKANIARASMEGATLGLRYGLDVLRRLGITPSEIRLVGGGSKSGLWRQMVSDVFDCPAICPLSSEAGAVGAALQAMWCYLNEKEGGASIQALAKQFVTTDESSRTLPRAENVSRYAEIYQHYLQLNNALKPLFESETAT